MAVVTEKPVWEGSIRLIDPNDPVQGGAGGVDNVPHEQLANRTAYLKQEIEGIKGEPTEEVTLESLLKRIKELEEAPAITVTVLPIGATFETTLVYTSGQEVAAAIGYGEWQPFAEGRVTVGVSSKINDPDWTKVIGTEEGEYENTLTVEQIPSHAHPLGISTMTRIAHDDSQESDRTVDTTGVEEEGYVGSAGGGQPHNNVQPSVVVGKWVRTA
ncbi:hypothetical protein [uncultured Psychrobacter sp.]|mgnify:CR=1 FL=1|uniref:phage baseplate protein n=1 Tax=uncultured Psychrobacter sp. TaxID=259303 RepID=UPI002591BD5A|nr:hypothetical protein [uncultured Psychrobacter sp.]